MLIGARGAMLAAKPKKDVYSADKLLLWFDGVLNVAKNQTSLDATTWADLAHEGRSASINEGSVSWFDNGAFFDGRVSMSVTDVNQFRDVIDAYNAADRTGFTIEYALTISARARMFSIVSAHGIGPFIEHGLYGRGDGSLVAGSLPSAISRFERVPTDALVHLSVSISGQYRWLRVIVNGTVIFCAAYPAEHRDIAYINNVRLGKSKLAQFSNGFIGTIHAIRIYGRELDESELLTHAETDRKRFSRSSGEAKELGPMKISRIQVRNYRAIRSVDIDLHDANGMCVLAGLNGSGKTSVLEACMSMLNPAYQNIVRQDVRGSALGEVSIELIREANGDLIRLSNVASGGCYATVTGKGKSQALPMPLEDIQALRKLKMYYLSSWRAPRLVGGLGMTMGNGDPVRAVSSVENNLADIKQMLVNLQGYAGYASGKGMADTVKKVFERLNRAWRRFYPDEEMEFLADIAGEMKFDIFLRKKNVEKPIPVDALSSGEIELFSLITALILEQELRSHPYDFVFMDEPELHLNQVWHRLLLPVLLEVSPKSQFVVATHSEDIWNSVYESQRFFLKGGVL